MSNHIVLTQEQMREAAYVGVQRHIGAIFSGMRDRFPTADPWSPHIEGACAEYAAALLLDLPWPKHIGTYHKIADLQVPGYPEIGLEVRSTVHNEGHLIMGAEENPTAIFLLMVGKTPRFEFRGWTEGLRIKARGESHNGTSFWMKQCDLRNLLSLKFFLSALKV